ncbi:MAG TPA: pantoate--beta-alanine ligase [Candidatus Rikenella faecigallinarum]|uniref:Pantothenate synthetase n=1 Tax=Candidatus Rikenella faecigallinarum TaxID=2838745 RepID=A0A9D1QEI4_9BACT|nr:pantoate--beta-alanine ligase [Candidatus Rikenella faecigallinarum]
MKLCRRAAELAGFRGTVGFVPTMGALHAGHLSLVEQCRKTCDTVVVSIFVNPTQFNDPNDLKNYPRTEEADLKLLEAAGVDYVFAPSVEEVYPEPDTRVFDFGGLDSVMEGAHRPGHFNGVGQVVSRLFDIVKPNRAFFGEKDFQQLAIIRYMVQQLGLPIEIVGCPIVRDSDGLARSSRNMLLTPEHRQAAPHIYAVLREAVDTLRGTVTVAEAKQIIARRIDANPLLKTEYVEIAEADTLKPAETWGEKIGDLRCFVAVHAGPIRLIDNVAI